MAGSLAHNTTPEERRRGCKFSDRFRSQQSVVINNGIIIGTPTYSSGLVLTRGAGNLVYYNLDQNLFNHSHISVLVEFTPSFTWRDDNVSVLVAADDGAAASTVLIVKQNNAGNNVLSVYLGNVLVADIPAATYSPYWLQGQRNLFIVSGTTGNTNAWLNGTQVLTADPTAWGAVRPTLLYVGATYGAAVNSFDGTIRRVAVFHDDLEADEVAMYWGNTPDDYLPQPDADFDLAMTRHDPTNSLVLDAGANNYNLDMSATAPAKLTRHKGYSFNGVNNYLKRDNVLPTDPFIPAGDFSACILFRSFQPQSLKFIYGKRNAGAGQQAWMLYHSGNNFYCRLADAGGEVATHTLVGAAEYGQLTFLSLSYQYVGAGTSIAALTCKNGNNYVYSVNSTAPGPIRASTSPLSLGVEGDLVTGEFNGEIYDAKYFDGIALNKQQTSRIYRELLEGFNHA